MILIHFAMLYVESNYCRHPARAGNRAGAAGGPQRRVWVIYSILNVIYIEPKFNSIFLIYILV